MEDATSVQHIEVAYQIIIVVSFEKIDLHPCKKERVSDPHYCCDYVGVAKNDIEKIYQFRAHVTS